MTTIDAVLFDFGGVFVQSPFEAVGRTAANYGVPADEIIELVFGPYHLDTDHAWHQVERGELPLSDYRDQVKAVAAERGLELDPWDLLLSMGRSSVEGEELVRTAMLDAVRSCRNAGCRTAIVTNNLAEIRDQWKSLLPVEELFDLVVDSSEEGIRKPDPRIYQLALDRLGVTADASVFLDDAKSNVEAAEALGITGIWVESDYRPAIDTLLQLIRRSGTPS